MLRQRSLLDDGNVELDEAIARALHAHKRLWDELTKRNRRRDLGELREGLDILRRIAYRRGFRDDGAGA